MTAANTDTIKKARTVASTASGITVRRMDFDFSDEIPADWFDGNPFLSAMMAALSVSFPAGERYFIDSVRHFQSQIKNPEQLADIRAFIGQEANHTKEHIAMNDFLERKGFPAHAMDKFIHDRIAYIQKKSTPEENLARTVALEHFTAIMAKGFMDHPQFLGKMHPQMAQLWAWHALEEVEHKSVAFDVYKAVVNDESLRRRVMMEVTFFFLLMNSLRTLRMMQASRSLWNLRAWAKGLNFLWGNPGVFRKIIPEYLEFYRKDFHPTQQADSKHSATLRERYAGMAEAV